MAKKKYKTEKKKNKPERKLQKAPTTKEGRFKRAVWIRRGIFAILIILFSVLSLFWIPGEVHYVITETYQFEVNQAAPIQLSLLLPTSGPYQKIQEPQVTWPGTWTMEVNGRLAILTLTMDLLESEKVEAVVQYQVNLWQGKAIWSNMLIVSGDLEPNQEIPSDQPEIESLAASLQEGVGDLQTARQIFDFTVQHLHQPEVDQNNGVLSVESTFVSSIDGEVEPANLLTALYRAGDIPAHPVSGYVMPSLIPFFSLSATWDHPADIWAWVEVYAGDRWQFADPSRSGNFYQPDLFGRTDGRYLVYSDAIHEKEVYSSLVNQARDTGEWIAAMSAPLKFVAWSSAPKTAIVFNPIIKIRKTWDARILMMISISLILGVVNWLMEHNTSKIHEHWKKEAYEDKGSKG